MCERRANGHDDAPKAEPEDECGEEPENPKRQVPFPGAVVSLASRGRPPTYPIRSLSHGSHRKETVMAKRFFYVCAGIFLLALTYHLGARSVAAQAPSNPIVAMVGFQNTSGLTSISALTANGDFYEGGSFGWTRINNVFNPTSTKQESLGQLKVRYR